MECSEYEESRQLVEGKAEKRELFQRVDATEAAAAPGMQIEKRKGKERTPALRTVNVWRERNPVVSMRAYVGEDEGKESERVRTVRISTKHWMEERE